LYESSTPTTGKSKVAMTARYLQILTIGSYRDREGDYGQRIQPREQEHRFRQHDTSTVPQSFIDDEQRQAEERALRRDGVVYMR
jgi:hypothetical protein